MSDTVRLKNHWCVIGKHEKCTNGYREKLEKINPFPEPLTYCSCDCHGEVGHEE